MSAFLLMVQRYKKLREEPEEAKTYRVTTLGGTEYLTIASSREEAMRLYTEAYESPHDPGTHLTSCEPLIVSIDRIIESYSYDYSETERLLCLYAEENEF